MRKFIIFACLSIIHTACMSIHRGKSTDGYDLYVAACEKHESLYASVDASVSQEIRSFRRSGGMLSEDAREIIDQHKVVFDLIRQAHNTELWSLPDITTFSAASTFPYLSPWYRINQVATAHAIQMYLADGPQDVLSFLMPFNSTGLRVSKAGTLLHVLMHTACRTIQYPVLVSAIDGIPETLLAQELERFTFQYAQIPSVQEMMAGEQYMALNTAKEFFSDLRAELQPARAQMIEHVRAAGVDEQVMHEIESGEMLSVDQWEEETLSTLKRLQSFVVDALATRASYDMEKLDDEIEDALENIGGELDVDSVMASWSYFMTHEAADGISLGHAEELHAKAGRAISYQIMRVLMPPVGALAIRHREFIASERLLLIRLAVRLYTFQHGNPPTNLQELVDSGFLSEVMIMDPLSGETFRTQSGATLEVYSMGRNLVDNNGVPWNHETQSGDLMLVPLQDIWNDQQ